MKQEFIPKFNKTFTKSLDKPISNDYQCKILLNKI